MGRLHLIRRLMISNISPISRCHLCPLIVYGGGVAILKQCKETMGCLARWYLHHTLHARICNKCGNAGAVDESLTKELLFVAFGYSYSLYRLDLERAKNAYKKGDFL
jgi:hypothetical protein